MKFIREAWNTGIPQLLLLLAAALLVMAGAQWLLPALMDCRGVLAAHSAQDFALTRYFTGCLVVIVYLSASGATRMRT